MKIVLVRSEDFGVPEWLNVSRETEAKLAEFARLVKKWSKAINLVSAADASQIWQRHILDSAQLYQHAPDDWQIWADFGSGGGFPGLVIAILSNSQRKVVLVESDTRKCAFLKTASISLDLNTTIQNDRIELLPPLNADIISVRALAPVPNLLELAQPHLAPGGTCLFLKGSTVEDELTRAALHWKLDVEKWPSKTESTGTILKIGALERV